MVVKVVMVVIVVIIIIILAAIFLTKTKICWTNCCTKLCCKHDYNNAAVRYDATKQKEDHEWQSWLVCVWSKVGVGCGWGWVCWETEWVDTVSVSTFEEQRNKKSIVNKGKYWVKAGYMNNKNIFKMETSYQYDIDI